MEDYSMIINNKENYITFENKKHIIFLDFENQLVFKKERQYNGDFVEFSIEEFIYINNLFGDILRGDFNGC